MRALLGPRRAAPDHHELAEDARVLGIAMDIAEPPAEQALAVYDDCLEALALYQASLTQARLTPMGGFIGFDYPGVEAAARLARIEITPELFADLRGMEAETTAYLRQRAREQASKARGRG